MRTAPWLLLLMLLLQLPVSFAWDGDWTDGYSGRDAVYDPEDSHSKAGSDPPQTFLTPPPRDWVDIDPNELDDYYKQRKRDYTPYAALRIAQPFHYEEISLPIGYYQVKIANLGSGSQHRNLNGSPTMASALPITSTNSTQKSKLPTVRLFLIKSQGKVMAVIPIHQMEVYKASKKEFDSKKVPKQAIAWIAEEDRRPVLNFYYQRWLYKSYLQ